MQPPPALATVSGAFPGHEQGHKARCRRPVRDRAFPAGREPAELACPVADDLFELGERGGGLPAQAQRSKATGHYVAQDGGQRGVGGEPGEVAGVLRVGQPGHYDLVQVGYKSSEGLRRFGWDGGKSRQDVSRGHLRTDRQVPHPQPVVGDPVDELVTGAAELFGAHTWESAVSGRARPVRGRRGQFGPA